MALEFSSTADDSVRRVKGVIYGEPGAGKTTMAADCQSLGKVLIVSAEGGLASLANDDISVYKCKTFEQLTELANAIKSGELKDFDVIFIDSLTEIGQIIENHYFRKYAEYNSNGVLEVPKQKNFAYYGAIRNGKDGFARMIRDQDCHVFMTALPKRWQDDESGQSGVRPNYGSGAAAEALPGLFDFIFALQREEDPETQEQTRVLYTDTHMTWLAKARQLRNKPRIAARIPSPKLDDIVRTITGA